jgi:opacity protein-like surface antigen
MKSMHVISSVILLFSGAFIADAAESSKTAYDFSGFYLGVSSGYNHIHNKTTETFSNFSLTGASNLNGKVNQNTLSGQGLFGGGQLGFGKQFDRYYLGAQFEGNLQNTTSKQNDGNSQSTYNMGARNLFISLKNTFVFSLKTGVALDKALIYAKAGVALSKFNVKSEYPFLAGVTGLSSSGAQYFNKRQVGLAVGVGVDVPVAKHVILTGEAGYTQYKKFTINHPNTSKTDVTPSALSFQLKASYKF